MRKFFKAVGLLVVGVVAVVVLFLGVATATAYRPSPTEALEPEGEPARGAPAPGQELSFVSFNIGYGGLGKNQDFFMDGGKMTRPGDQADVLNNLDGIVAALRANPADAYLLQEVDSDSRRSFGIDEVSRLGQSLGGQRAYALNFKSIFTPYPWPPIGKVTSGLVTDTAFPVAAFERVSLPVPFSWPVSMFNLKRCLLVSRVALEGTGKQLVLVNLHLEAYESGEEAGAGREAQAKALVDFMAKEYAKGNYVVAGGDFNQTLPGVEFPSVSDNWKPGVFNSKALANGWTVANDPSAPTSRLNDAPWDGHNQLYGIDGFIVSPNVEVVEVKTLDQDFEFSDHNPVRLKAVLKE
jgi:endonuclease/exonuclease/phosphatase family metal-dependent hydrolase